MYASAAYSGFQLTGKEGGEDVSFLKFLTILLVTTVQQSVLSYRSGRKRPSVLYKHHWTSQNATRLDV